MYRIQAHFKAMLDAIAAVKNPKLAGREDIIDQPILFGPRKAIDIAPKPEADPLLSDKQHRKEKKYKKGRVFHETLCGRFGYGS